MKFKFLAKVLISMSLFSSLHANAVETNKTDDIVSQITQKNGVISFSSRVKNFGEVGRGEVLEHDFTFTNTGKDRLLSTASMLHVGVPQSRLIVARPINRVSREPFMWPSIPPTFPAKSPKLLRC